MINRIHLQCKTCNDVIAVRTSIGHGDYQEFAFPCPQCGVEIRYGMTVDQKNASFDYTRILNAEMAEMDRVARTTLTFNPEILIPCTLSPDLTEIYSPFVFATSLVPDMLDFKRKFDNRLALITRAWPVLRNLLVHFKSRNWTLYRQEAKDLGADLEGFDEAHLTAHCLRHMHRFSEPFRPDLENMSKLVRQRINYAESLAPTCCDDLRSYLESIHWIDLLFEEMSSLRNRWADIYLIIQPVFIVFDWDTSCHKLEEYTISQKRFDDIKPFYIDTFETLCRLSVIAGCLEGIISEKKLVVPKKRGSISLDAYRSLPNGQKKALAASWSVADVFASMADNQLRNGVGHHAAKYDVVSDEIRYRTENASGVLQHALKYVLFCEKIVRLYGALEIASIYVHWAQAKKCGLAGRVV